MRINNNLMAMNTHRQLGMGQTAGAKSMEKLSSGYRINRAGDDAAGLSISEKMRAQVRGLNQASRNAQDGISLIQTAEGALNETHAILQRMRELAVQSSTDTNTLDDRGEIQKEITELATEVTRISNNTEFNTQKLLDGTFSGAFHIGANEDQNMSIQIEAMDAETLQIGTGGTTTYSGGAIGNTSGDAVAAGVTLGLGSFAGDNVAGVTFDTSSATVTTVTPYTTTDALVTSSDVSTSGIVNFEITYTEGAGAAGLDDASEISIDVDGTGAGNWTVTDLTGTDITFTDSVTGDNFVYDGSSLVTTVAAATFDFDQAGVATTTYGGTISVGDTTFDVAADGTTSVNTSGAYDDISVSVGAGFAQGTGTGAFDITGQTAGAVAAVVGIDVSTQAAANTAITTIDEAVKTVSAQRSQLGAYQNRLEHTIKNLDTSSENLQASESRIRDVDMAKEMMEFTKNNILTQAAQAMLAQANNAPQGVLQLLR